MYTLYALIFITISFNHGGLYIKVDKDLGPYTEFEDCQHKLEAVEAQITDVNTFGGCFPVVVKK